MIDTDAHPALEPIAITGIGCRFPGGAHDPESFWALLCDGVDAIVEVPPDRWSIPSFYHPDPSRPGAAVTRWGGFVRQRVDEFDALFFGMSPREAAHLDPMQRWMLEVTWEALEDSGQVPERLAGTQTGVFVGAFTEDIKIFRMSESNRDLIDAHTGTGSAMTMVANRLSYAFDLRGPSVALDTACSSSLVAVHLACQSLWNGECALALAGGVNAMFKPEPTIAESKAGMLSPDGRCKTFDARANGYVRGEGAGVVVLKPLSRALAAGDPVYALIRGSAVNQDGHTNGITVPSDAAQRALMEEACRRAGVAPRQIQYVEAHGTGTPVGDPIEANALAAVLATDRPAGSTCLIGSVKTNIGHLEAAAGIAGLIKAALCLAHRQIPPHLHLQQVNPRIPLDELCVRVPQTLEPWPAGDGPALAAVNSFGFGGTNAHVILQEGPPATAAPLMQPAAHSPADGRAELVVLSARSPRALQALARGYRDHAGRQAGHDTSLRDLAYTAALRRSQHDYRLAVVAQTPEDLAARLEGYLGEESPTGSLPVRRVAGSRPRLAFVLSGMGPQWWAMGRQLLEQEPVFRAAIERCDGLLRPYAGWSLLEELLADETRSRMGETQVAQPANFALQVALAELWRSWGIEPDAIVGHSAGEVAAAYLAGVMSLDDAVRVIYHRSRLQHLTTGMGKLVAVGLPLDEARAAIAGYDDRVSIAAVNSPSAVTLVGDPAALEAIVRPLQEQEIFCRFLAVDVPYHSHYMDPLHDELLAVLGGLDLRPARVPLVSTVTGAFSTGLEMDAGYWWRNVRDPVLFAAAVDSLIDDACEVYLEVGPHPVLAASVQECLARRERPGRALPSLRRKTAERVTMLESLGALHTLGVAVDFAALHPSGGRLVRLPTYPWQRERHWEEAAESVQDRLGQPVHPLLGGRLAAAQPAWEVRLDRTATPFLDDHRIQEAVVYPAAAYIEMGLAATRQLLGEGAAAYELHDIEFRKALFWPDGADPALQLVLHPQQMMFDIYSRPLGTRQAWQHHAHGVVGQGQPRRAGTVTRAIVQARCAHEMTAQECYARFAAMGLHYGPCFQGIARLWRGEGEALAEIRVPDGITDELRDYLVHPALLDTCFQVLIATVSPGEQDTKADTYMPVGIDRLRVYGPLPAATWVHTRLTERGDTQVKGELRLCDDEGRVVLEVEGLRAVSLEQRATGRAEKIDDLFYEVQWQAEDRLPTATEAPREGAGGAGRWLIFADGRVGRSVATLLEEQGETCIIATAGESYRRADHGQRYDLNPAHPAEFHALFQDAFDDGRRPCRGIVYLWGLEAPTLTEAGAGPGEQAAGCIGLLHTVQAVEGVAWRESPRLWVVTRGAQAPGGDGAHVEVAQAPLWGLARTIGHQEHGALWGGIVDLDPDAPAGEASLLFEEIWADQPADQVAIRGRQRYVPLLARRRDLGRQGIPPRFRADGSYLITGGLGGLGLQVAAWMVERGARRLILMGRTPLPARADWGGVQEGTPVAARIAAVRGLEALGASMHVAAVDVADERELAAFLEGYRREGWPPIRGVVHSAGVTHSQLLLHMEAETFDAVLRPKVRGAWSLHCLLREEPLDFFVLFSSVAALGFSMGLGSYAAGNAFLDALAHYRRARGLPALSINWGPWAEVGMASQPDLSAYFTQRGLWPLAPEQGLQGLAHLLGGDLAQAAIVAADWRLVERNGYATGQAPRMLGQLGADQEADETTQAALPGGAAIREELRRLADPTERQSLVQSYLGAQVSRVLRLSDGGLAALDAREPLNNLGIDSLMAIELKNAISIDLRVAISVVSFLQGASIADLAAQVLARLGSEADGAAEPPAVDQAAAEPAIRLDELSDADVDALLSKMLAEGTVTHE